VRLWRIAATAAVVFTDVVVQQLCSAPMHDLLLVLVLPLITGTHTSKQR
jgi:hypothetical protein